MFEIILVRSGLLAGDTLIYLGDPRNVGGVVDCFGVVVVVVVRLLVVRV